MKIRTIEELIAFSEPLLAEIFTATTMMMRADLEGKANFNPSQPRIPARQPTAGQWTEVGVVLPDDNNQDKGKILEYVTTIKTPQDKTLNRANIFIGGKSDDKKRIVRDSRFC
jgi:hypothetical protein